MLYRGLIGIIVCVVGALAAGNARAEDGPIRPGAVYEGMDLVVVDARSREELAVLRQLGQLLVCREGPGPQPYLMTDEAAAELAKLGIAHSVEHENMRELVEASARRNAEARAQRGATFYSAYATLSEIEARFDGLVVQRPDLITKVNIGQSLEGRNIYAYRIVDPVAVDPVRVVINGTQHAREWLSPMTNTYIAEQFVTLNGSDPELTEILKHVELVVIPVVNPDGYVYTHTTSRFWRKNRRNNGDGTFGVDLNRNWGYEWNGGQPGSSDGVTSSEIYRGTAPFSEPETTVVSDFIASLTDVRGHIDFHTYGALILGPWGYSDTVTPPRESELRTAQDEMAVEILDVDGLAYLAGLGVDQLLYTADGVMPDWTFGSEGALAWTIELRPSGSLGLSGFDPDPINILPAANEGLAAVVKLCEIALREIEFTFPQGRPALVAEDTAAGVTATLVKWHGEDVVPGTVRIATRIGDSGPFAESMASASGDEFTGTLPAAPCGSEIEYYFIGDKVGGGTVLAPTDAPSGVYTASSVALVETFTDDFETDTGWSVSSTATDGQWERGVPAVGNRGDPSTDADGSGQCYLTDNVAGNSDVDNGTTTLTSPVFDLSDGGTVSYSYWYDNGPGVLGPGDGLFVEVSTDPGNVVWDSARSYEVPQENWLGDEIEFGAGAEFPASATARVRFIAADPTPGGGVVECGVDAVEVNAIDECPIVVCEGDADGNGTVDVNDISYVLFRLGDSGTPGSVDGDADGSGTVDVNDISYVLFRLGGC